MSNGIRHVFFDLDHTLWDFDKNSGLTFEKIFNIYQIRVDLPEFLEVYEPINLKYWKLYREEQVSKKELRYGRLKEAFDRLNMTISDAVIHQLSEEYITYLTTFNYLFDGTVEILDYLNSKYELHIITNGFSEAQERKILNSNIKPYFKTITNSEMVGVKKPNPKIFNFALDQAQAHVKESLMVGDSLEADIEGAEGIGMDTILFDYKNRYTNHKYKSVTHLAAIKDLL